MAGTTKVRIRPGQVLSHGGKVYKEGDELDLPTRILPEFHWQIEEIGEDGQARPIRSIAVPGADAPHERKAILEQQLEQAEAEVEKLKSAIQAEDDAISKQQADAAATQVPLTDAEKAQEDLNRQQTESLSGKGSKDTGSPALGGNRGRDIEHVDEAAHGGRRGQPEKQ